MKECKRCFELLLLIKQTMLNNMLAESKEFTKELLDLLNGYDTSC